MKLAVGLVGRIAAGKSVISQHLVENYGADYFMFSQVLIDVLQRLNLPPTRENLQGLGMSLRKTLGQDVIVNALKHDLEEKDSKVAVIDGIRYENEVEMLRGFKKSVLIHVVAPSEVRYQRCRERGEKGEHDITYEEFLEAEEKETERYIDELGREADHTLKNTGSIEELINEVDEIMQAALK